MNAITDNKAEIILSEADSLILQSIQDNLSTQFEHIIVPCDTQDLIKLYPKIDLLIVLEGANNIHNSLYKVKLIVNLTDNKLAENEIKLNKPFRLSGLINIIKESRHRRQIFCEIAGWLYDEQLACIFNAREKILLTEKENDVMKYFVLTPSSKKIQKNDLLKDVWRYHQDSDSTTIETHLFRLKNKLPDSVKPLIRME